MYYSGQSSRSTRGVPIVNILLGGSSENSKPSGTLGILTSGYVERMIYQTCETVAPVSFAWVLQIKGEYVSL